MAQISHRHCNCNAFLKRCRWYRLFSKWLFETDLENLTAAFELLPAPFCWLARCRLLTWAFRRNRTNSSIKVFIVHTIRLVSELHLSRRAVKCQSGSENLTLNKNNQRKVWLGCIRRRYLNQRGANNLSCFWRRSNIAKSVICFSFLLMENHRPF